MSLERKVSKHGDFRKGEAMRHLIAIAIIFWGSGFCKPADVVGQESCSSPIIFSDGSGGETQLDLATFRNDHATMCSGSIPGPDVVFLADGSNVDLELRITNEGQSTVTLQVLFTYWCHADSICDAVFSIPVAPYTPLVFNTTIVQPVYIIVDGPSPTPSSIPLRFNYSLGSATPVKESTWGVIKSMYGD
jgi:hypothetical protein